MRLQAHNITLQRGFRVLVRDFGFDVEAGEGVTLRGPNGSGKTTLLRTIAGFHTPRAGQIKGTQPSDDAPPFVSFLGHHDPIKAGEKLYDQLAFWARLCDAKTQRIDVVAEQTGLTRQLDLQGGVLSAGQRRRASLARLLLEDRDIWLLDEPAAPLDAEGRAVLGSVLDAHRAKGGLFVAAVHDDLPGGPTRDLHLVIT
jgi:heme exporter protein A